MAIRDLAAVIAALYASEINCGLETFYDAGMTVWIGDEMNGRLEQRTFGRDEFDAAADWLHEAALHYFPNSRYARS